MAYNKQRTDVENFSEIRNTSKSYILYTPFSIYYGKLSTIGCDFL